MYILQIQSQIKFILLSVISKSPTQHRFLNHSQTKKTLVCPFKNFQVEEMTSLFLRSSMEDSTASHTVQLPEPSSFKALPHSLLVAQKPSFRLQLLESVFILALEKQPKFKYSDSYSNWDSNRGDFWVHQKINHLGKPWTPIQRKRSLKKEMSKMRNLGWKPLRQEEMVWKNWWLTS